MQLIFYCHSLLVASNLSDARRMVNFHKLITSEFHQQGCEFAGAPSKCKSELLKQNFCFCKLFHQCIHFCSDKGLKRGFQPLHMSFCAVLQNPNCKSLDVIKDSWNKEGKSTKNVYCSGQLLFLNSWIHLSTFYVIVSQYIIHTNKLWYQTTWFLSCFKSQLLFIHRSTFFCPSVILIDCCVCSSLR